MSRDSSTTHTTVASAIVVAADRAQRVLGDVEAPFTEPHPRLGVGERVSEAGDVVGRAPSAGGTRCVAPTSARCPGADRVRRSASGPAACTCWPRQARSSISSDPGNASASRSIGDFTDSGGTSTRSSRSTSRRRSGRRSACGDGTVVGRRRRPMLGPATRRSPAASRRRPVRMSVARRPASPSGCRLASSPSRARHRRSRRASPPPSTIRSRSAVGRRTSLSRRLDGRTMLLALLTVHGVRNRERARRRRAAHERGRGVHRSGHAPQRGPDRLSPTARRSTAVLDGRGRRCRLGALVARPTLGRRAAAAATGGGSPVAAARSLPRRGHGRRARLGRVDRIDRRRRQPAAPPQRRPRRPTCSSSRCETSQQRADVSGATLSAVSCTAATSSSTRGSGAWRMSVSDGAEQFDARARGPPRRRDCACSVETVDVLRRTPARVRAPSATGTRCA